MSLADFCLDVPLTVAETAEMLRLLRSLGCTPEQLNTAGVLYIETIEQVVSQLGFIHIATRNKLHNETMQKLTRWFEARPELILRYQQTRRPPDDEADFPAVLFWQMGRINWVPMVPMKWVRLGIRTPEQLKQFNEQEALTREALSAGAGRRAEAEGCGGAAPAAKGYNLAGQELAASDLPAAPTKAAEGGAEGLRLMRPALSEQLKQVDQTSILLSASDLALLETLWRGELLDSLQQRPSVPADRDAFLNDARERVRESLSAAGAVPAGFWQRVDDRLTNFEVRDLPDVKTQLAAGTKESWSMRSRRTDPLRLGPFSSDGIDAATMREWAAARVTFTFPELCDQAKLDVVERWQLRLALLAQPCDIDEDYFSLPDVEVAPEQLKQMGEPAGSEVLQRFYGLLAELTAVTTREARVRSLVRRMLNHRPGTTNQEGEPNGE
jgi:hypothetical protein